MAGAEWKSLKKQLERGEEGAIHEARKLSRQVGAELKIVGAPRHVQREWKHLRRAVAPVRDHDVTGEHLAQGLGALGASAEEVRAFEQSWSQQRGKLLAGLKLPPLPQLPKRPGHFKKKARAALVRQSRQLEHAAEEVLGSQDPAIWHEWRKALKQYRYTSEVLGPLPPVLKQTLDALGRMQDAEVALGTLAQPE